MALLEVELAEDDTELASLLLLLAVFSLSFSFCC